MNGAIFRAYVAKFLIQDLATDDIVIMDILASHKSDAVRETIENVGAELLFLSAYHPISIRSKRSGMRSVNSSTVSRQTNAQTTSGTQDIASSNVQLALGCYN